MRLKIGVATLRTGIVNGQSKFFSSSSFSSVMLDCNVSLMTTAASTLVKMSEDQAYLLHSTPLEVIKE